MNETFISYSRKDSEFVTQLFTALKTSGHDPWFDQEDIRPASNWQKEILIGVQLCHNFVFVLSPDAVDSPYCLAELSHALLHNKRLIPIVSRPVDPTAIHPALGEINWIFFTDFAEGLAKLLEVLDAPFGSTGGDRLDSKLEVVVAAQDNRNFFLYRNRYLVGRNPLHSINECGLIVVPGSTVSRRHLELVRTDGRWTAKDVGSRNGVKINSLKLRPFQSRPLRHGDVIVLAPEAVCFYSEIIDELQTAALDDRDTIPELGQ